MDSNVRDTFIDLNSSRIWQLLQLCSIDGIIKLQLWRHYHYILYYNTEITKGSKIIPKHNILVI